MVAKEPVVGEHQSRVALGAEQHDGEVGLVEAQVQRRIVEFARASGKNPCECRGISPGGRTPVP